MIKNYLKIAIRNLKRYKGYALINITGLTLGITCSCLLLLYINNELSFDQFHADSDKVFRIIEKVPEDGNIRFVARTAGPTGPSLVQDINGIETQTRIIQPFGHLDIKWNGERLTERRWSFVDSTFFDVFSFEFIEGNRNSALDEPNAVVITERIAQKYFGNTSALNKTLEFDRISPVKVKGVIRDMPSTSHFKVELLLSKNTGMSEFRWWTPLIESRDRYLTASTYIKLSSVGQLSNVNAQIPGFITKYYGEENPTERDFYLQSISDIYLNSEHIEFDIAEKKGDIFIIYIFGAIAIFIIIIACINYINLATARSTERAKEIGVRKVSGAIRGQLVGQFLSESVMISIIAFIISIGLVDVLLPHFNELVGSDLLIEMGSFWPIISILFGLAIIIGLVSGSYPALYLSKLKPSQTLKGDLMTGKYFLRKVLVITQFSLGIVMIVATLVVSGQMDYIRSKKLGFDKENMLVIDINSGDVRNRFEAMKSEFEKIPEVQNVAVSSRVPGEWKNIVQTYITPSANEGIDSTQTYFMCFDDKMLDTYSLTLASGKNFSGNVAQDSTTIMLNESAVKILGQDNSAIIGSQINFQGVEYPFTVIGVIEDFHFQSLHENIAPLAVGAWANPVTSIDYFSLKIASGVELDKVIKSANTVHETFDNQTAMEYHFLDQQLNVFYEADQRAEQIFAIGAGLTIFIACLGLFGLASFMVRKKMKEVSIRKVLGATRSQLFFLLSKTFILQILIATIIAVPISWYMMSGWLDYFAYKINVGVLMYLMAGGLALLIALITTGYQSIKATNLNPAETLKNE